MSRVIFELPAVLVSFAGNQTEVAVDAADLDGALAALYLICPALEVHLQDATGGFREHVLCFVNGVNTRWGSAPEQLSDGDRITIMQAVSGG